MKSNFNTSKVSKIFWDKGFLGGVAMASPFYAEFFPWNISIFLVLPFLLFFIINFEKIKKPSLAILPMMALLLLHIVSLIFSKTIFADQVIKDVLISSFLLFIYVLTNEDMHEGFFTALLPLALLSALVGLAKAALLDRGYIVGFILDGCSYYSAGSALCANYNNTGFMWLVAILACIKTRFWWIIPFLVAAGALSSSRRFILLVFFIPIIWIIIQGRLGLIRSVITTILAGLLIFIVSDPVSFEKFRFGGVDYKILNLPEFSSIFGLSVDSKIPDSFLSINRATPDAMLSTMNDGYLGTGSRIKFWDLGISMVNWYPQGWSYHEIFSCEFSPCTEFMYPHFSIISEWIIGGVFFAFVAIAFYVWPFLLILQKMKIISIALFLFVLPYSVMSGDTVFSLPICISGILVALSCVPRRNDYIL